MTDNKKIAAWCVVKNNTVSKNGRVLFEFEKEKNADAFLLAAYQHFTINYPKFYKMDNLCKLGIIATEVLLKDEVVNADPYATGIVLSNSNASLDADIKYYDSVANIPSPALFVYTLPNIVIGEISIKYSSKGENAFFIFDSFDAGFITQYVNNLFETTVLQTCICGWVDLLKNDYEAVLFLVEKTAAIKESEVFTKENLNNIYHTSNGKS
ncbi:hypothetical protein FRZ67_19935 [Panacibacter ginsenosidivorans]|uniref:3-oxoacyl-ACP synthase n=1 Tax=Panacibacter ginsenosidivorans TaxID=1813871 RepID=A0A5B8VDA9_9BACT|nr:hypothetical protein [Panacibacter ginsenosidivorans]QEC69460.1 hypothetical protein FRZ67_19935 [Panacibacter ginsenosidivorans]